MIDVLLLTNSRFFFCGMPFSISTFLHNHFFIILDFILILTFKFSDSGMYKKITLKTNLQMKL
jgi:hypothetical protein